LQRGLGTSLSLTLVDELPLELLDELEVEVVLERQGLLTHHGLHGHHVLAQRIVGVLPKEEKAYMSSLLRGLCHQSTSPVQH
jgi:hypothetical protein